MRFVQINLEEFRGDPRYARWSARVGGQPGWVWRLAALAAALVLVPIVALVLAAAATFMVVYLVLAAVHAVAQAVRRLLGGSGDGRRNVRVVRVER